MNSLVKSITQPLAGCMLLSAVLRDRTFALQTRESFDVVFKSKTGAFSVLGEVVPISSLDWLVAFTSVSGFFGGAGQVHIPFTAQVSD
jgi:hypothetical protein